MAKSIMQDKKECYITRSTYNLHLHHIFGGPYRKKSDKYGLTVWLRADWHNMASYGVHNDIQLMNRIRRDGQRKFEELYGHEKFMKEFGKNYL